MFKNSKDLFTVQPAKKYLSSRPRERVKIFKGSWTITCCPNACTVCLWVVLAIKIEMRPLWLIVRSGELDDTISSYSCII